MDPMVKSDYMYVHAYTASDLMFFISFSEFQVLFIELFKKGMGRRCAGYSRPCSLRLPAGCRYSLLHVGFVKLRRLTKRFLRSNALKE